MKIVNRGYIIIKANQPFFDWANQFEDDMYFSEEDDLEPTVYLIEDEFMEVEPVIQQNFKKIFINELSMITDDESEFPQLTEELFYEWFEITAGTTVIDTLSSNLQSFDLDE